MLDLPARGSQFSLVLTTALDLPSHALDKARGGFAGFTVASSAAGAPLDAPTTAWDVDKVAVEVLEARLAACHLLHGNGIIIWLHVNRNVVTADGRPSATTNGAALP